MAGERLDIYTRHWRWWVLAFWVIASALLLYDRWGPIQWFSLGDTDDNLRIMQVRALLAGQDWYDLRQYRLAPPAGADIHWSRLVDLPIIAIRLALQPLLGGAGAERWAVALAPLLPMAVAMAAMAVAARRLVSPKAFALGVGLLLCAHSARAMWSPLRIDHHGWQLALLAVAVAALADRRPARGGLTLGIATALSLAIGLEMLVYLALAGAAMVLMWTRDGDGRRLLAYGGSLAGGCALAFVAFASEANRAPVCDALSPVWLSAMAGVGALGLALALLGPARWPARLALAAVGGALLVALLAVAWPGCLGRPEQVSAELDHLWLSRVREAMPVYNHAWRTVALIVSLPLAGLAGYALMLWRSRRDGDALAAWGAVAAPALVAAALLLWQTRAAPAAQLLAVPGVAALAFLLIRWIQARASLLLRVAGTVGAFVIVSGLGTLYVTQAVPAEEKSATRKAVDAANRRCPTIPALRPVARQAPGTVLTFVDLGPRLIVLTPHSALAGPYHRNGQAIVDVMRAWRGDADNARETTRRYGVDYVLICPGLSESTIYRSEAPDGFYAQLAAGRSPGWLEPIALPEGSPYMMWRVLE